jgi:hypothetical protein
MNASEAALLTHPTAAWLEACIALAEREGQLVRNKPLRFSDVARLLAEQTGHAQAQCEQHLREVLLWLGGTNKRLLDEGKRYTHLPFKLHQFFSQTGAIYVTWIGTSNVTLHCRPAIMWWANQTDRCFPQSLAVTPAKPSFASRKTRRAANSCHERFIRPKTKMTTSRAVISFRTPTCGIPKPTSNFCPIPGWT